MKTSKQSTKSRSIFAIKLVIFFSIILLILPDELFARLSNDPYVEQWSYKDTKVYEAWDKTTGSSEVVVAIIDSGFDTFHPDIYPNAWKNEDEIVDNGIDDDKNGYIDDVWGWDFSGYDYNHDGIFTDEELLGNNDPRPWIVGRQNVKDDIHHGTLVAGIIGAVGNNNQLGAGINWNVKLMNLKVLEVSGVGDLEPLSRAIRYAADNGADVINISLVGDVNESVKDSVKYAYDKGVAIIAAAGNDRVALNISPVYPICADAGEDQEWILGVSAIGEGHYLAPFSNTGSTCIDLTAPGINVSTTMRYAPAYGLAKKFGGQWQGTSFAAPFVSATAALIKSIQPNWTSKQIYEAILSTVHRTPPDDVQAYEEIYGAGLIQVGPAIDYALSHIVSNHVLDSVFAVDFSQGSIVKKSRNQEIKKSIFEQAVKDVDDVDSYNNGYATTRKLKYRNLSEIVIYNKNWKQEDVWWVESHGKLNIKIGDILEDDRLEVVLSPAYSDKQVLRVFSLGGEKMGQLDIPNSHSGVSLGLIGASGQKKEVLAVYNSKGKTMLYHFNKDFTPIISKELDFIKNTGSISAGDIDGDGAQEYVVGAGAGDQPFLAYYEPDGSLKRKFYAYAGYIGGLDIAVWDYDEDGKDDVVVAPMAGGLPARVWNNRSKKIDEWQISGKQIKLLPVYK